MYFFSFFTSYETCKCQISVPHSLAMHLQTFAYKIFADTCLLNKFVFAPTNVHFSAFLSCAKVNPEMLVIYTVSMKTTDRLLVSFVSANTLLYSQTRLLRRLVPFRLFCYST